MDVAPPTQDRLSAVGGEFELWSSRDLNLAWLPRLDNCHNPSLLSATLPEAVYAENPVPLTSDQRPVWFWRVEPTFGAWVVRAIRRAGEASHRLPDGTQEAFPVMRRYLETAYPGCWTALEERSLGPVVLPGIEIVAGVVEFARLGFIPRWQGFEKLAEKLAAERAAQPQEPVPGLASRPQAGRPRGRADPAGGDQPGMFE